MRSNSLRERLSQMLDEWDYDFSRFDISSFTAWVQTRRGRPILVHAAHLPANMFGAWFEGDRADYIFYEADPPEVHTVHNLLHELSHILLGHRTLHVPREVSESLQTGAALDDRPDARLALNGLFRYLPYEDEQEAEAETLSSLIQQRAFRETGLAALTNLSHDAAMQQFVDDLGFDH